MSKCLENAAKETKKESLFVFGTGACAVLNIIASSVFLLVGLIGIIIYVKETVAGTENITTFLWCLCLGGNLFVIIMFTFAVLLFIGLYKKKPGYVLAYFIYGVLVDISLVSVVVICNYGPLAVYIHKYVDGLFHGSRSIPAEVVQQMSKTIIGICVVYTLVLYMICRAWIVMRSRRSEEREKLISHINELTAPLG